MIVELKSYAGMTELWLDGQQIDRRRALSVKITIDQGPNRYLKVEIDRLCTALKTRVEGEISETRKSPEDLIAEDKRRALQVDCSVDPMELTRKMCR